MVKLPPFSWIFSIPFPRLWVVKHNHHVILKSIISHEKRNFRKYLSARIILTEVLTNIQYVLFGLYLFRINATKFVLLPFYTCIKRCHIVVCVLSLFYMIVCLFVQTNAILRFLA